MQELRVIFFLLGENEKIKNIGPYVSKDEIIGKYTKIRKFY